MDDNLDELRQLFVEQGCKAIDVYCYCGNDFNWEEFIDRKSIYDKDKLEKEFILRRDE